MIGGGGTGADVGAVRDNGAMYVERPLPHGSAAWRSLGAAATTLPADGCLDLIVREGSVLVAGPSTRPIQTLPDGVTGSFGLRISPGLAAGIVRVGLGELSDLLLPLDAVSDRSLVNRLTGILLPFGDGPRPMAELARLVAESPDRAWAGRIVTHARARRSLGEVVAAEGTPERTLRRRVRASFGYGYGTLVRLERARSAQRLIRAGASVAEAAARAGYADQPHLTREFRRIVGATPAQFAASGA